MKELYNEIFNATRYNYTHENYKKTPSKIRWILYAFAEKLTLTELNELLAHNNCTLLCEENIYESITIRAFAKGLDFEEWLKSVRLHSKNAQSDKERDACKPLKIYVLDDNKKRTSLIDSLRKIYDNIFNATRINYVINQTDPKLLRIKLFLYAFAEKLTLAQLKELLLKYSCADLYSRNIHDASIIHAFTRGLTFEQWLAVDKNATIEFAVKTAEESNEPPVTAIVNGVTRLSLTKMQEYLNWFVTEAIKNGNPHTNRYTDFINNELLNFAEKDVPFEEFVKSYKDKFVVNRQRSRRYVIDGLCSYLTHKLKKNDAKELFVTPLEGEQFDSILLKQIIIDMDDYYQNTLLIKRNLWEELNGGELEGINPDEAPQHETHEAEAFADYLSGVLKGKVDISRNFLLVFLVFTMKTTQLVTIDDFNTILDQCGFYPLDENDADMKTFDFFILETIESDVKKDMEYLALLYDRLLEDFYVERQGVGFVIEPREEETTLHEKTDEIIEH